MPEFAPVETAARLEHRALRVAGAARRGAHRIGRLEREQRLVAVDGVHRRELAREVRVELAGAQLGHCTEGLAGCAAAMRRSITCTAWLCMSRNSNCSSASLARICASE